MNPTLNTILLSEFEENLRLTRALEEKVLASPAGETYKHLRWHTTHPGEWCPICLSRPSKGIS